MRSDSDAHASTCLPDLITFTGDALESPGVCSRKSIIAEMLNVLLYQLLNVARFLNKERCICSKTVCLHNFIHCLMKHFLVQVLVHNLQGLLFRGHPDKHSEDNNSRLKPCHLGKNHLGVVQRIQDSFHKV